MVEHRRFGNLLPHLLLLLGVAIVAFPVHLALIAPTYQATWPLHRPDPSSGTILPRIASGPATLLLRHLFRSVPKELVAASQVDGAGPMRFFWDTLLPLSVTTIAALFVILFIYGWNQYLWPLLITTRDDMQTIVIGIKKIIDVHDALTEWQAALATPRPPSLPPG